MPFRLIRTSQKTRLVLVIFLRFGSVDLESEKGHPVCFAQYQVAHTHTYTPQKFLLECISYRFLYSNLQFLTFLDFFFNSVVEAASCIFIPLSFDCNRFMHFIPDSFVLFVFFFITFLCGICHVFTMLAESR